MNPRRRLSRKPARAMVAAGMTILEILLAMGILAIVLVVIAQAMYTMQSTWVNLRTKADGFRNTRVALDLVSGRLSQAMLNTRRVTKDSTDDPNLKVYESVSDLHFVSGHVRDLIPQDTQAVGHAVFFQAPFGKDLPAKDGTGTTNRYQEDMHKLNGTLNAWGYFVEYGSDNNERPHFMRDDTSDRFPPRKRFRLLEFRQPAGDLSLFEMDPGPPPALKINKAQSPDELFGWFRKPLQNGDTYQKRHLTVIAENIVAFVITPLDPKRRDANSDLSTPEPFADAPNSTWNSRGFQLDGTTPKAQRHSLPPALQLTAISVSEDFWAHYSANAEDQQKLDRIAQDLRDMLESHFRSGQSLASDIDTVGDYLDDRDRHPPGAIPHRIITLLIPLAGQ